MIRKTLIFLVSLYTLSVCSQDKPLDSIQYLDEVVVKGDRLLRAFSKTQQTQVLLDSVIKRNGSSLTQLLNQNSSIYFRENGFGMVSSPSFRGTNAQQTAVIWNGININSQLNGQTDFNTINTLNFNDITIRSGGGSVIYGSGAIGGSIHLNDKITFKNPFKNELFVGYGSFNTLNTNYRTTYANEKFSAGLSIAYTSSDNDYEYELNGVDRVNLNGQFYNVGVASQLGYKINAKHTLKFYNYIYDGERHFSIVRPSETRTKYRDSNTRHLLEWEAKYGKFLSVLRGAYITESYKFFDDITSNDFSFGEAKTLIGNYQLSYKPNKDTKLLAVSDINHTNGEGSSIAPQERTISAFSLLLNQRLDKFYYEAAIRKEFTSIYDSPVLFSLGLQYQFSKHYQLNINGSKNYRIPTYNDLYWDDLGNIDLVPETSYQIELGQQFNISDIQLNLIGFYNDIENLIRWLPDNTGVWRPENTDHVITYGLESRLKYNTSFAKHNIGFNLNYAYTVSENKATNNQLIYVPFHKGAVSLNYNYKTWSAYWQSTYSGEVFTQSDNNPNRTVMASFVSNLGTEYKFPKHITLGVRLQNLFNVNYQSIANRVMPGFNSNIYINFEI